ncbi:MAG TPA: serine/threonine-protein kinase [Polyangiaceae bacterium]|nr:serine/threonine-protein kinase [Polyangiaceae bacterium]
MSGNTAESRRPGVPAVGEVIAQKYRVESVVGAGGMGVVVSARHLQLGQVVAIKLLTLPPDEDRRDEAIARFLHEAQAAAKLQSDHVVRIYDVGQLDSGLPFMVMELLSGTDLGTLLEKQGALPEPQAIDLLLQACAGVAEAHRMGIVHRDLKPSNLFVTTRSDGLPLLKVLDFGISKQLTDPTSGEVAPTFTNTRTLMGSPNYMSPEQIRDARRVDGRTDVWALGIILQELITDAPVFRGESFPGICAAIVADPPMPVRAMRPDVSAALEQVIDRCLRKSPEQRFQSIAELVSALSSVGTRGSISGEVIKPIVYSSHPRVTVSTSRSAGVQPASQWDAATISTHPEPDMTLESARLKGGTRASPLSPDSRVQVLPPRSVTRARRWLWILLGGFGVCAAFAWLLSSFNPASSQLPTSPSAAPSALAPAKAATFTLSIDSEPLGATVSQNGQLLGSTPLSLTLPEDSATHVLVLEKDGYEPYVLRQAAARGEVHVRAALAPRPQPATEATAKPSASPAKPPAPAAKRPPAKHPPPSSPPAPSDIRLER